MRLLYTNPYIDVIVMKGVFFGKKKVSVLLCKINLDETKVDWTTNDYDMVYYDNNITTKNQDTNR